MAFISLCVLVALSFFAMQSLQQGTKDPLNDFCRRWGHQTAQVDGKLYIDGGQVAWNPLSANPLNYTNTWLLYSDLNTTTDVGMPAQYANLTKNSTVPSVSGGILWADEVNKCFYLYGGEYQSNPSDFSFWTYDTLLNQWNETEYKSNVKSIQRVSFGAGAHIDELGVGFYYGGWMNNNTSPSWGSAPMASSNMIRYDYTGHTLNNNSGPDNVGRAEGSMVYLPASDGGLLAYFGGIEQQNGTAIGANMSTIHIFDVASSKWYTQKAGGDVPDSRRQFCAGATWADDYSSYNIYLYGGFGIENVTGFDDAYILTLPSFTWIRAWPVNTTATSPHGGCSANVIHRDQMLIIGGWFPASDICDSPNGYGQHNMVLGENGAARNLWDKYDPQISAYFVPTPIISVIGGGPTGKATATQPSNWDNADLAVYFTRRPSFSARSATRALPTGTSTPTASGGGKTNVGAIAGGVVGGLVGLIAILLLILFCLHRRKKALKNQPEKAPAPTPPVELAAASPVHEMASPGVSKHLSLQNQPDPNAHPAYSVPNSIHSRSPSGATSHSATSPYQPMAYASTTPTTNAPYPSPHGPNFPHNQTYYEHQNAYAPYSDNPQAYDYPPPHVQRYDSYPTPTSPNQQQNIYYPPPPDPSTRSHPSYSDRDRLGSPTGTQFTSHTGSDEAGRSASNTPAHFYGQVVNGGPGSALSPPSYGGEASSSRGSLDSRKRPARGRFVEVDHM
ncbi:hypothetical protein EJ04DRAFT_513917 [Polyplosphaeria fusca]|uniref:Cell wall anchored protein n=1 Tax=Polyplosphaeria fusca TaxID=682080 RepID=A0A9P4QX00_9PLEO|nr:hypothetical protein EJ04DRAFT_513917 [Polyplosphaeria fusca]